VYRPSASPKDWIKDQAGALGVPMKRILSMSEGKDPFNIGSDGHHDIAAWFKGIYQSYGYFGIHLRKLHYRVASQDPKVLLWDGETPYMNINLHWSKLQDASKVARILRYVDAGAFTDQRNKATSTVNQALIREADDPDFWVEAHDLLHSLPRAPIFTKIPAPYRFTSYASPDYGVTGYDYHADRQPHLVEIWSEAEEPILHNLARRNGVNYIPGLGYASISMITRLLRRMEVSGVPEGDAEEDEERIWLFDSDRFWEQQTQHFRKIDGKADWYLVDEREEE
jgi:hypothetical protein